MTLAVLSRQLNSGRKTRHALVLRFHTVSEARDTPSRQPEPEQCAHAREQAPCSVVDAFSRSLEAVVASNSAGASSASYSAPPTPGSACHGGLHHVSGTHLCYVAGRSGLCSGKSERRALRERSPRRLLSALSAFPCACA